MEMKLSIEDATWIGLKLKSIIRLLKKAPAGGTIAQLREKFPTTDSDNLEAILELAIALELIKDDYEGDARIYKLN